MSLKMFHDNTPDNMTVIELKKAVDRNSIFYFLDSYPGKMYIGGFICGAILAGCIVHAIMSHQYLSR